MVKCSHSNNEEHSVFEYLKTDTVSRFRFKVMSFTMLIRTWNAVL